MNNQKNGRRTDNDIKNRFNQSIKKRMQGAGELTEYTTKLKSPRPKDIFLVERVVSRKMKRLDNLPLILKNSSPDKVKETLLPLVTAKSAPQIAINPVFSLPKSQQLNKEALSDNDTFSSQSKKPVLVVYKGKPTIKQLKKMQQTEYLRCANK